MSQVISNVLTSSGIDRRAVSRGPALLLAVDQPLIQTASLKTVFRRDHDLVEVGSGSNALDFCAEKLPDLIFLSLTLSDMHGREVCRRLKDNPITRYLPIIFLAEPNEAQEEADALQDGAVDFIVRPFSAAVLRARVQTHLMLRRATKQILAFNETLSRRVAQRTIELEATIETLYEFQSRLVDSEARATLSTVVANVSHELMTPISNSMLTADALKAQARDFNDLLDSGQLKRSELGVFLKVLSEGTSLMERNLQRASALIGNFKQVAMDQISEERREFDLAATARDVIASLMPSLKKKPHRIVLNIPDGITLNSLPGRLEQVMINLINNAYLHAFEGRDDGVLNIVGHQNGDCVELGFVDNGVGMSEDALARLFQPFFTTKKGKGGSGLGLAIVDNLVRHSLGGSISVKSTPGVGTAFDLVIKRVLPL